MSKPKLIDSEKLLNWYEKRLSADKFSFCGKFSRKGTGLLCPLADLRIRIKQGFFDA